MFSFSWRQAFDFPPETRRFDTNLMRAMAAAGLLAMYNYGGYSNICNIGEEIRAPERTMPRAIVLSIAIVVVLYVVMSTVILGMVPWQEARQTRTIASLFIARTFADPAQGRAAAIAMTALILFVTASSLYAVVLGYSRIPFAAARDGQFFRAFGRLHSTKHFPHVSLVTIGAVTIPFCFFSLGQLVNWLIQVQILLQFVWQCAAVMLLRRYRPDIPKPFKMWLYPLYLRVGAVGRHRLLGRVLRGRRRRVLPVRKKTSSEFRIPNSKFLILDSPHSRCDDADPIDASAFGRVEHVHNRLIGQRRCARHEQRLVVADGVNLAETAFELLESHRLMVHGNGAVSTVLEDDLIEMGR
jgi:hypothetical protein